MSAKFPKLTAAVFLVTAILTGLQFAHAGLLGAMERTPAAISASEYWRLFTPIWINRGGWREIGFNLLALALVGSIVERLWGRGRWLLFYLLGGLVGELAGLAWRPIGAGCSVAVAGLLGALAASLGSRRESRLAAVTAMAIGLGAIVLTGLRDLHGPPLLAGVLAATVLLRRDSSRARER